MPSTLGMWKRQWELNQYVIWFDIRERNSIMFVRWAYSWEGFLTQALTAPVTSILHANHLQSILNTLSSILQSVMLPTFSKLSDLIGRVEAFSVATLIYLVSWVVHATSNDYGTFVVCGILFYLYFNCKWRSIKQHLITGRQNFEHFWWYRNYDFVAYYYWRYGVVVDLSSGVER